MDQPLSDVEIRKYIPNVILYDQLNTQDVKLPVVILYETKQNFGHWTLLHETPEGVEFFDSYGKQPDSQFDHISKPFQKPHWLLELLKDLSINVPIHYNDYTLQSPSSSTCGRWCILRHQFHNSSIDEFARSIAETSTQLQLSPDQLVIQLTS